MFLLIASSMILLVALQVFWLQSSYRNEVTDLRRQGNIVFRNTVFQVRDSISYKNLKLLSDTVKPEDIAQIKIVKDSASITNRAATVQVFISSTGPNDTLINLLRPLARKRTNSSISFRIAAESLNLDTLQLFFQKNLLKENINMPQRVVEEKSLIWSIKSSKPFALPNFPPPLLNEFPPAEVTPSPFSDTLQLEVVRLNPSKAYSAQLFKVRSSVLKSITPQILFSLFLTLLTALAFWVMFKSMRSQQRLMEMKNDFISNVAHELKTPVTTVGVALEALKNFNGLHNPTLTEEYLDIAQKELNRLSLLTDKILKTAIFENKGVQFTPEAVHLDDIVEQVLASMKLVFEKQGATLTWTKTGSNFEVMGGSIHLTSVVYNLIDNALKYSPTQPDIHVSLIKENDHVVLTVQDNGLGISRDYQKRIFEKFFRVPTGNVHNIKGYGLGLNYVQSVVKAHHAKIELESEVGAGSKFILTFPAVATTQTS